MNISQEQQLFSSGILRLVGYGLLLMAAVDLLFVLIPLQLMNPVWELKTIGQIVDKTPVSLLGMVLVYYGEKCDRAPVERILLRWLSRMSLLIAIVLFLTIPLSLTNSFRIYYHENAQINTRLEGQVDKIQELQQELETVKSTAELSAILQQQAKQNIKIPDSVNSEELKLNILEDLQANQKQLETQAKTLRDRKRGVLLKNCLKWNLGGFIAAILYLLIWKSTRWARFKSISNE